MSANKKIATNHNGFISLAALASGISMEVAEISCKDRTLLHRLTSMGIYPGVQLTLIQKKPASIVRVGETDIALEPQLLREIWGLQTLPQ